MTAIEAIGLVARHLRRAVRDGDDIGIARRLSDFGMTESDVDPVTEIALTSYYFDIECHPHPVSGEDITRIYRQCL